MITYKGLPAPIICDHLSRVQSRQHDAPGTFPVRAYATLHDSP
jgi:hypothetical protein